MTDLSLTIHPGETVCVVGESGSGKSIAALATTRLLPKGVRATFGAILLNGRDVLKASDAEMRSLRGREIGMIFQEPLTALNPVMRIGNQIKEVLEAHGKGSRASRKAHTLSLIAEVGLPDPARIIKA